jgi:hypothetical protein
MAATDQQTQLAQDKKLLGQSPRVAHSPSASPGGDA